MNELVAFAILGIGMFLVGLIVGAWYAHREWMQATLDRLKGDGDEYKPE